MPGQDVLSGSLFKVSQLGGAEFTAGGSMMMLERIQTTPSGWLFIMLFGLIGFFAWIRAYYGGMILQTVQATTNYQVTLRMFRDNSMVQKQLDNVLYLLYFLNGAFFFYLLEMWVERFPYGLHGAALYLFNIALLAGVFLARLVLVNVTGFLFNRMEIFREYLFNIFIFNKISGMVLLPLFPFLLYTTGWIQEAFFWMSVIVVLLTVILRVARSMIFSLRKDISILYMFLYLCALEIVPLMLLFQWIEDVL
jgi:hypothetical protein